MSRFIVGIELHIGGYMKNTFSLVTADNEDDACYLALCGETHNEPITREQHDADEEWWDDYMIYTIDYVTELTEEKYDLISQLI